MPFLGSCEVCQKTVRTWRSLAGHLRHNTDEAHQELRQRWLSWRSTQKVLSRPTKLNRCWKCGITWEKTSPTLTRQCQTCKDLQARIGKRAYEKLPTHRKPPKAPKTPRVCRGKVSWTPGDALYQAVVKTLDADGRISKVMKELGLTYKVVAAIAKCHYGSSGYQAWVKRVVAITGSRNVAVSHARYRALTSDEKAKLLRTRFGGTCALERKLSEQLLDLGVTDLELNCWQSILVQGVKVPREADLKITIPDGRKVVVLCDGEAFHGPGTIHGNPNDRICMDRETALGFFNLGYSVVRYSETEVHSGEAVSHLVWLLRRLDIVHRVYRNWYPEELMEVA